MTSLEQTTQLERGGYVETCRKGGTLVGIKLKGKTNHERDSKSMEKQEKQTLPQAPMCAGKTSPQNILL